jgi:hypothetical protein
MAVIASSSGAYLACGQCNARFEFAPSYVRCLPIADAFAAGWGTARTDKGIVDHACPECLAGCTVEGSPIAVPDDPPSEPGRPEHLSQPFPPLPAGRPRAIDDDALNGSKHRPDKYVPSNMRQIKSRLD